MPYKLCIFLCRSIAKHLGDLRDENKKLVVERERLRRLLQEREEDVKAVRTQLARSGENGTTEG